MAASKWHSIPFFALLIISFASTKCLARHVSSSDADKDNKPLVGLSAGIDSSYSWQYWQWSWGTPSPNWFPWGSSSLYCRPVNGCVGNCNDFYLEFDYDQIRFSYNNYYRKNEVSVNENDRLSPRKDEMRKRPEDGKSRADNHRDNNDNDHNENNMKRPHANVVPGSN